MPTNEELINQMYDSNLASKKTQLQQSYETADSAYAAAKEKNAAATDQNLTRTAVEGQKAAMNMAQLHDAQGLSSGARAQARLSLENQTGANMTALRTAQQDADAEIERQRALLAKDYTAAIAKAQSDNDLQRAQALYEQAQKADAQLLAKQEAAAGIMAGVGDFSAYKNLYGLSDAQIAQLSGAYKSSQEAAAKEAEAAEFEKQWKIAKDMAELGDESYLNALLVASGAKTEEQLAEEETAKKELLSKAQGVVDTVKNIDLGQILIDAVSGNKANGNTGGVQGASPQQNADGTFTISGATMSADQLLKRVIAGDIIETVDPVTGTHFFKWRTPDTPQKDNDAPLGMNRVAME